MTQSKPSDLHMLSVRQLSEGLAAKQFSSVELTQHYLQRIAAIDGQINSYVTVTNELALAQAKAADQARSQGNAGVLSGIPLAHKDIFCTQGIKTTAGSRMLGDPKNPFIAPYDATVVAQCNQAGLVTLGKVNMDEFAMGSSNENSYHGATRNPWAFDHVPGGSSGGSAAAVAADLAPLATGTDTGGSIRQPAAFCGLTGIKPTYGRVSRFGMIAYASSFDQAGPMARSAEDCAYLLGVMAGHDPRDSTSVDRPVDDYATSLNKPLKGLRIGLPRQYFGHNGLHGAIQNRVDAALKQLEQLGATLIEIDLDTTEAAIPAYYLLASAEASSNLSRYDGVRYGYRCDSPQDLTDLYTRTRAEGFGEEVQRRILIGTYALSAGYYDAYYVKAQKVRRLIQQDFLRAFEQVDVIAGPTTPSTAYQIGAKQDPVSMYLGDVYTIGVNLAGLPAMSVPVGVDENKLPVGLQLIGNYWSESTLLALAHQYQQHTDWHLQRSPLITQSTSKQENE
ncbi:Asp-tRNA(Asn)/Glu-tRNA(Gln) amidotransferase subunit GatA [Alkanindiges sp. WGS2144]|uniref:Asp-tRNA(Asn)/Glu-tRNA(Gln) amidotransferase subunit GatA n=1 Tax=Alkanindiges sp. WGS2144 TaxID=3366808 RepID=UPI00375158E7